MSIEGHSERGEILYTPSAENIAKSRLTAFAAYLSERFAVEFADYSELHAWSLANQEEFWLALAGFFQVSFHARGSARVLTSQAMPGARWFQGYTLNYAEHALRTSNGVAIIYRDETGERRELSFDELRTKVASCRAGLRALGVGKGDAVVAYLGNCPEAVIAFLATASLGAIWSSCPPEFGADSVLDRFEQIAPKVLVATDAYHYAGRRHERAHELDAIRRGLPETTKTVLLSRDAGGQGDLDFGQLLSQQAPLAFEPVAFEHPLWVLYSSGTTGKPKAIVQGHGGILLEHLKVLALHSDLGAGDRFFWFSTTGWMMWNYLVSGLLLGTTIVLYEGSPGHPDLGALWRMAQKERLTYFGTSAPFLMACRVRGVAPSKYELTALRAVGSTGAPLPKEGFRWVYDSVKADVHLGSVSGGTDLCTAFLLSCPWLPVRAGELQCAALGADVQAFDEHGGRLTGQVGELVIAQPMPSMPLYFWNDPAGERLRSSYFERFDGVWAHGDWLLQFEDGAAVIFGRSDATLNRGGVRMGTSEFYRVVENIPGVKDSLVVDTSRLDDTGKLWLFVVLSDEADSARVFKHIRSELRQKLSPRHVPDAICKVDEVPYTLSGKKLEVPVKRVLTGTPLEQAAKPGTLRNPDALAALLEAAAASG